MTNEKWLEEIEKLKTGNTINADPHLIGFIVREWEITEAAEMKDLCWSMCKDGYVTKNDALFLLEQLEKYVLTLKERN